MANNNKLHTSKVTAVMPQLRSPQSVDMSIFNQQMSKMRSMSANNGISKAAQNVLNDMESRRKQSSQNVRSMIQSAQKERAAEAARRQKTEANLEPYRQLSEENAQKVYRKLFTTDELNGTATVGIKDVNNLTDDDFQLLKGRAQQRLTVNTRKGEEKQNELENNILRDFISQIPDNGNVQTPTQGSARYVKQDKPTDVFNMPSNEPVSDDTEFSIPINKDRNISVKYRTVKAIDDYVNGNQKQNKHKTAQGIDSIINGLGLDGKELDDAKSYAGLKKLSLFDNNSSKNVGKLGRAERIITYLPAKAYKGMRDFTYSAKNFMANLGGSDDLHSEAMLDAEKYYTENPDKLGNDIFDNRSNFNYGTQDYFSNVEADKLMGRYDNIPSPMQLIGSGVESAGGMLASVGTAGLTGIPQVLSNLKTYPHAITKAASSVKNAVGSTNAGNIIGKAVNATPKIAKVAADGKISSAINKGIGMLNKVSVGKAVKFLNPLDNPTTALMGITSGQEKYNELRRMGYSKETSKNNALFTGYVNTVTEKMGYDGTDESLFIAGNKILTGDMSVSAKRNTANILKKYLSSNVSEGMEEVYATVFERMGDYFSKVGYVDDDGNIKQRKIVGNEGILDLNASRDSFLGGFVGGAVMGSAGVLSNIANTDTKTIKAHADIISKQTARMTEQMNNITGKAGVDDISMPKPPTWSKATLDEINTYYAQTIDTFGKLLTDERVINNDSKAIENATNNITDGYLRRFFGNVSQNAKAEPKQALNGLSNLSKNISSQFNSVTYATPYADIFDANVKFLSSPDNVIDREHISDYAKIFVDAIADNNSMAYNEISKITDDIPSALTDSVINNTVPDELKDNRFYLQTVNTFEKLLKSSLQSEYLIRNKIYSDNATLSEQMSEIINNGNFSTVNSVKSNNNDEISDENSNVGAAEPQPYARRSGGRNVQSTSNNEPVAQSVEQTAEPQPYARRMSRQPEQNTLNDEQDFYPTPENAVVNDEQENTIKSTSAPKNTADTLSFRKVGDFYEMYGNDAVKFAQENGLKTENVSYSYGVQIPSVKLTDTDLVKLSNEKGYDISAHEYNGNSYVSLRPRVFAEVNNDSVQTSKDSISNSNGIHITESEQRAINQLSQACNVNVEIVPSIQGGIANGVYKNGKIYIAEDAENKPLAVLSHEITHHFENTAPEAYELYRQAVIDIYTFNKEKDINAVADEIVKKYSDMGINLSHSEAIQEIVADYTKNLLTDEAAINDFINKAENLDTTEKKSVLQNLHDAIVAVIDKIKSFFGKGYKSTDIDRMQKAADALSAMIAETERNSVGGNFEMANTRTAETAENTNPISTTSETTDSVVSVGGDLSQNKSIINNNSMQKTGDSATTESKKNVKGESRAIIKLINDNRDKISDKSVFDVSTDDNIDKFKTKSDYILNIFNEQGNVAHNPQIGTVELSKSGAKSTVLHGFGKEKLAAAKGIKSIIEKGNIIEHIEQYNNGIDRYVIAANGVINGEKAVVGVVIKSYPKQKHNSKFYLHEAEIIKADSSFMTAPQLSVDTVDKSAVDNSLSQNKSIVNNNSMQKSEKNSDVSSENILKMLSRGEKTSLEDVKSAVNSICNNEADIKAELSKLTNAELKQKMNIVDRGSYSKKADMVNAIYNDMLSRAYYTISGKNTMSMTMFGGKSFTEQTKDLVNTELNSLTEERLKALTEKYSEEYKKRVAEREERKKGIENPQTLDDYLRKKRTVGLSESENSDFERLYAITRKERRTADKSSVSSSKTAVADDFLKNNDNFTIEESTHSKTGEKIWVVKPKERLATDEWKNINSSMKSLGGFYWKGNGGWNFKKNPIVESEPEVPTVQGSSSEKLRTIADNMQKSIDECFKDRLTNTAKRAREAASATDKGEKLQRTQATIRNIADGIESGNIKLLTDIDSKAQVDTLFHILTIAQNNRIKAIDGITYSERLQEQEKPYGNDDIKHAKLPLDTVYSGIVEEYAKAADGKSGYKMIHSRLEKAVKGAKDDYVHITPQLFEDISKVVKNLDTIRDDYWNDGVSELNRLKRMGIESNAELRAYLREFVKNIPGVDAEAEQKKAIKQKEIELANSKIDGFFPTPKNIVEKMLDEADIKKGETVLEPSAGKGNIADEIRTRYPDNALEVAEINGSLAELLKEKGHNVVGNDFLATNKKYDKIIMNPPFEKLQDIDHVKHAYDMLNPGGRLVAIMSESPFFNSAKKAEAFRTWLEDVGGVSEKLPENSFKNSERSTGVNTRLVVIDKGTETPSGKNNANEKYSLKENDLSVNTKDITADFDNLNKARKEFVEFARKNFPQSVVNQNTQKEIGISRTGIDKFLSGNITKEKYATGFKIPQLIESAVKVGEAENKKGKQGINGYEYYYNTIAVDGNEYAAHIRVRNTDMGDKYYGHTISKNVVDIEIEPLAWNSDENKSVHPINAVGSSINNISHNNDIVNSYDMQNGEKNSIKSGVNGKTLTDLIDEYGSIEKGEKAVRDIQFPKRTSEKQYLSKFARTIAEAGATPDSAVSELEKSILDGKMSHIPITNKGAMQYAVHEINVKGFKGALDKWNALIQSEHQLTKNDIALGQQLYNQCINNKDVENAIKISIDLCAEETRSAQNVQAARMLKMLSADGQLYYIERAVQNINNEMDKKGVKSSGKTNSFFNQINKLSKIQSDKSKNFINGAQRNSLIHMFNNNNIGAAQKALLGLDSNNFSADDVAFIDFLARNYKKEIIKYDKINNNDFEKVTLNPTLAKKFLEAENKEARDTAYDEICQDIADQIPVTKLEKWNAWRYLSMLGNPRTHIRNITGNAVFYPVVRMKSYLAAAIEHAVLPVGQRTTSLYKTKESKEYAAKDFEIIQKELQGVNAKYALTDDIQSKRPVFKTKLLEFLRKKNGDLLELEDMLFLKKYYTDAFARFMTARNLTEKDFDISTEKGQRNLETARAIAFREAQEATYRDDNAVAEWLSHGQKNLQNNGNKVLKGLGYGVEALIPFKKTPLNIVRRGVEYSPAGLLSGIYDTVYSVKKGNVTAAEAVNKLAKGLTGTVLTIIGFALANKGIATGAGDEKDKKRKFDTLIGKQSYSLNIGGKSYTIDWAAPDSLPFFVGVELYNAIQGEGWNFAKCVDALGKITEPMLELSCLQGISNAIESVQYNGTNTVQAFAEELTTSYITQALPTLAGQIARITDGTRRNAYYTYKDSSFPASLQRFIGGAMAKTPFVSRLLEPKIDSWGREEDYGQLPERVVENLVSPGYYSEEEYTAVDKELERLYKSTGEADVLPVKVSKKITYEKEDYNLNVHEYTDFSRLKGKKSFELIKNLINGKNSVKIRRNNRNVNVEYKNMTDEEKVKAISNLYNDAGDYAKEEIIKKYYPKKYKKPATTKK